MKKLICTILILSMAFISTVAYADPTPSPSPEQTDAYSGELISYGITGETVVRIQLRLRELGYFNYKPTGSFQNMTVEATKRFQQKQVDSQGQPIMSAGTVGAQSMGLLFSHRVQRADIAAKIPIGKQLSGQATLTGELMEWSAVKDMLVAGSGYTITDYNTGVTFTMEFNYSKRPVIVTIGANSVAASLQGQPHGEDTVAGNDMEGHACLYFSSSTSHVASLPDVEHQAQVYKAAGRN